jgi:hypothetical protein
MQLDRLLLACLAAFVAGQSEAAPDVYPMPRDASVADILNTYSVEQSCSERMLRVVKRTAAECADRLALAKKECAAKIAEGLPDELTERDAYRLAGRSKVCVLLTISGRPYRNAPADSAAEALWKRDHGEAGQ